MKSIKSLVAGSADIFLFAAIFWLMGVSAAAQDYGFPFKGEDLNPGERIHVVPPHGPGIQAFGYDMGAFRHTGSGQWSRFKDGGSGSDPKDHIIHGIYSDKTGLPFYAMASGEVIGCWRNSPDDPDAGLLTKVIRGGNHVWIRQDDGLIALYAHAAAGTIPSEVCPYDEVYTVADYSWVGDPDVFPEALVPRNVAITVATGTVLPAAGRVERPRVRKGQFLGRVGYTGATGGIPHIHIHMETGGANSSAAVIRFESGLTTPVTQVIDFNTIEADPFLAFPFPNGQIPLGEQLIRPPRTTTYRMMDFESFEADGHRTYAGILVPGSYGPMALFQNDWDQFVVDWQALEASGYRMKDFESFKDGDKQVYSGIFAPGTHSPKALFQTSWDAFFEGWQTIESDDYRLKDLEVFEHDGERIYAGIFEPGSHPPNALFNSDWNKFLEDWQALEASDYRMKDFETYLDGSERIYAGIFEPGDHAPMALFEGDWAAFLSGWQEIESQDYRMVDLEVFRHGEKLTYVGIFEPGTYPPAALFVSDGWESFLEAWQHLE